MLGGDNRVNPDQAHAMFYDLPCIVVAVCGMNINTFDIFSHSRLCKEYEYLAALILMISAGDTMFDLGIGGASHSAGPQNIVMSVKKVYT